MKNDCCKKYFLTFATETKLVYKEALFKEGLF